MNEFSGIKMPSVAENPSYSMKQRWDNLCQRQSVIDLSLKLGEVEISVRGIASTAQDGRIFVNPGQNIDFPINKITEIRRIHNSNHYAVTVSDICEVEILKVGEIFKVSPRGSCDEVTAGQSVALIDAYEKGKTTSIPLLRRCMISRETFSTLFS